MGTYRKVGKALGSMIFIMFLITAISVDSLSNFTDYETAKPIFVDIIKVQLARQVQGVSAEDIAAAELEGVETPDEFDLSTMTEEERSEAYRQALMEICEGKDSVELPLAESGKFGGVDTITIDCNEFRQLEDVGSEAAAEESTEDYLTEAVAENIFDSVYYMEHDCGFIQCILNGDALVVLSAKGNEFLNSIKIWMWVGVAVGAVLLFVASEDWADRLKSFGWPMALTGACYFLMDVMKLIALSSSPLARGAEEAGIQLSPTIDMFMSPVKESLLLILLLGIIFTVNGYVLGYYYKRKGEVPKLVRPRIQPAEVERYPSKKAKKAKKDKKQKKAKKSKPKKK